jgi:hypothetical protein
MAVATLGGMGGERSQMLLERALNDSESSVRSEALESLRYVDSEKSFAQTLNALADRDAVVRIKAIEMLERARDEKEERSCVALAAALKTEKEEGVRGKIVESLRYKEKSKVAIEALKNMAPLPEREFSGPPADEVFAAGITHAAKESKPILIVLSCTHCPPCRMLDIYHADERVAAILSKYYVLVKIDTDTMRGGFDLFKKYGKGAYPSWGVLNEQGKLIANGEGFPSSTGGMSHYEKAFKAGNSNITAEDMAVLFEKLKQYGKKNE